MFASSPPRISPGRLVLQLGLPLLLWYAPAETVLLASAAAGDSTDLFEVWRDERIGWIQNSVTAIAQTYDGYLWLGTYHGLVRFDGVSFTVFDSSTSPELPNGRITSLYESPDHVLWIGHETGHLSRIAGSHFESIKLSTNWPGGVIEAITSDEKGNVWMLNDSGLLFAVQDGRTARTPGGASPRRKATLSRARNGKVWISSSGQIAILEQGQVVPVPFPGEAKTNFYERVFPAADSGVWVLGDGRVRKWSEGAWRAEVEAVPGIPGAINALIETRFGLLAGTMREGLYLLRFGAKPLHFGRAEGLSNNWVRALCVDQEGNCWIGTGTSFDSLRPRKVQMVAPPDNWQGCRVLSFAVQPGGEVWVGTEGCGLYRYDGRQWSVFKETNGLLNLFVWSVLATRQDALFVGTWGGGIFRRRGERFECPAELSGISAPVAALYEGRGGELWIGTQEGLHCYEGGKLVRKAGNDKLALPDVRTITESSDGTLWFGMAGGGLGSWKQDVLRQFRKGDGLSSDLVACLYASPDGALWIGTSDNGLARLKQGKFRAVSTGQGLPSRNINHIVDDGAGYLWLGTQSGIVRVSRSELDQCADGLIKTVACLSYGRAEGLIAQVCPGGFYPGACRNTDGRLWFPTVKGLAVVNPADVTLNSVPPPVAIEALLVDGLPAKSQHSHAGRASGAADIALTVGTSHDAPQEMSGQGDLAEPEPLRLGPGRQRLEFHYTGLSFIAPEKVRFRRMLEGLDHDWVDAGVKRVAEYNYLPPGNYTFRVTACNNDGVWNENDASVAFTVLPFFWQTVLFRAAAIATGVAGLAAVIFWLVRRRMQRKLDVLERQRAVGHERARIARDMHDELGASLTRISMLSETVRGEISGQPQAIEDVDQIHSTAREVTRAMDEIVWAVNPAHDTLDSLVEYLGRYTERYLSSVPVRCRLAVPLSLPPWVLSAEVRHNVFLAFKEALNNVLKHAGATEIRVSVELGSTGFAVIIMDNGSGFSLNPGARPGSGPASSVRAGNGNGLINMRKRMEEIGGHCAWETAPGEGTRVKLAVEVKR